MTTSDARKRLAEQEDAPQTPASVTETASGAPQGVGVGANDTRVASGPQGANLDLDAIRERAEFWASRDPDVTQRGLYDATAVGFAREMVQLLAENDRLATALAAAEGRHRDLVSRLGFGDNITEPMADNDTIVRWVEEQAGEAAEWWESQRWQTDCYLAGHPDDEDCPEHDPALRLDATEGRIERVRALTLAWQHDAPDFAPVFYERVLGALDEGPR